MAEEDVCGLDGVAADAIQKLGPTTRVWHGKKFELPTEESRNSNPCLWQGARQWRIKDSPIYEGYSWADPRTGEVHVSLNQIGKRTFKNATEAYRFLEDKCGYTSGSKASVETVGGHYMGYDSPNSFARAPDFFKAIAMALVRMRGNGIEASDMLRAYTMGVYDHQFDRMTSFLLDHTGADKWREAAALLNAAPSNLLAETTAGRFLDSLSKLNWGIAHSAAVLDDERISGHRAPGSMKPSEIFDISDARRNASNNGAESPVNRMLNAMRNFVNDSGQSMQNVVKYRQAQFVFERVAHVKENMEKALNEAKDKATESSRKTFVEQREAAFNSRGLPFRDADREAAENEFREKFREGSLPSDFHSTTKVEIEQDFNTKNPTQFEHVLPDGTKLEGEDGARAYLNSLSPEEKEKLATGNQIFSQAIDHVHNALAREGIYDDKTIEQMTKYGKNYIPQRDMAFSREILPSYGTVGRYTPLKDPYRNLAQYIDMANRVANENMVRRSIVDNLAHFSNSPIWSLKDVKPGATKEELKNGYIVSFPGKEGGPNIRKRLVINERAMKTSEGKALATLLQNDRKRNYLLQHLAGYTRFSSIMYTSAQPAWALKSMCINTFMTPIALQSAMGLNNDTRTAAKLVMPLLKNAMHDLRTRVLGAAGREVDPLHKAWSDLAAERGATSSHDPRYSTRNLMAGVRRAEGSVLSRLKNADVEGKGAFGKTAAYAGRGLEVARDEASEGFSRYQGIQHAPDEIFKAATFRTSIEHAAEKQGIRITTAEELKDFIAKNPDAADQATLAAQRIMPQFHHKGNWQFLNSVFPFFNASIQTLPFMGQLAASRFGQFGLASMSALGFLGAMIARSEFGDDSEHMKGGANAGFYLGHGVTLPQDYAFAPFLQMGKSMESGFFSSHPNHGQEIADVGKSFFDAFSPFSTPWEHQTVGAWAATHLMPPAIGMPVLAMIGMDPNGQPLAADTPADVNGSAIANPQGYEYGKASNSMFSTILARGISSIDDQLKLSPGAVSATFGMVLPGTENTINNFLGERSSKYGRDDGGTILGKLRDVIAPSFETAPAYAGGRDDMEKLLRNTIPSDGHSMQDYQNGVVGTARQQEVANTYAEAKQAASQITVPSDQGDITSAQLKHFLEQSKRDGDADKVRYYRLLSYSMQHLQNECWKDYFSRVDDGN